MVDVETVRKIWTEGDSILTPMLAVLADGACFELHVVDKIFTLSKTEGKWSLEEGESKQTPDVQIKLDDASIVDEMANVSSADEVKTKIQDWVDDGLVEFKVTGDFTEIGAKHYIDFARELGIM